MFFLTRIRDKIQDFVLARQIDILSAAMVLGASILASRVLGLVRDRILAHYFTGEEISLYFGAFRLPDTLFEILIFGTISAAFIPTIVSYLSKKREEEAWKVAGIILNLSLLSFIALAVLVFIFAQPVSTLIAPGFADKEINLMVQLTRILLVTQGFFVLSFFLTSMLNSYQRFIVPAIAPIFYNLGIIFGIVFLSREVGIFAPVFGAVLGSFLHFSIQIPTAVRLGFRPVFSLDTSRPGVKRIIRLATPRVVELAFLQLLKASDLFLASLISTASYGYLTFAQHLSMVPVSLFGLSLAEASLPALSYRKGSKKDFQEIFFATFRQIIFLTLPVATAFIVLRIPFVRLIFGAARFTWDSTVLTGYTLSAFALGVVGQALTLYFVRSFYALHNTVVPVVVGVVVIVFNISLSAFLTLALQLPVWGLAFSFASSALLQTLVLGFLLARKMGFRPSNFFTPLLKVGLASISSGVVMYVLLKIFDLSAWDQRLSFLGGLTLPERWELFVLDTRYTVNLLLLTIFVSVVGMLFYLIVCKLLRVEEVKLFTQIWQRIPRLGQTKVPPRISEDEH